MAREATIGGSGTLFVGEDKTLSLAVVDLSGNPVDISGWSILFDVRKLDASTTYIISKTANIAGTYDPVASANTQRAVIILSDDEMNLFREATYRHSWKRMTAGNETVLAWGDFAPQKATAP
jgi:hypothetical protein